MAGTIPVVVFLFFVFFGLAVIGGVIYVQIRLKKKDSKWLGYLLPGASFFISVLVVIFMLIMETIQHLNGYYVAWIWFGLLNIPTVVLLIVHCWFRKKQVLSAQIEKMNIQDLN